MALSCFVLGTRTIFSVPFCEKISIKKSDISVKLLTIDLLKEYIWEWKNNILKDLTNNASKFDLWHVNVDEVVDVSNEEDVFRRYTSFLTELKLKLKIKTFPHINAFSIDQLIDALALIWHVEVESDSLGPQNDPYIELKQEPSFFKINLPRGITKRTLTKIDLCLPSYGKSGTNYNNPFYDDPQFKETVSLVQKKIEEEPKDIIVLAGVSGGQYDAWHQSFKESEAQNPSLIVLINKMKHFKCWTKRILIFDESQILCGFEYGKYQGSSVPGKEWNLLQVPNLHTHIVLKLPFLSHDDVLRNLDAVIDLTHVTPETRNLLGYILRGRPRKCASFVHLLISKQRSNGRTKDLVLQEFIWSWYNKISYDMAKYLANACEYLGANNLNPETAIMDSPECIILGHNDKYSNEIEINPSLESYLINSIGLFLENTQGKKMVDVFVDNIIMLNNISSIGNEFDAVFIMAIIQKRGINVRKELNKWKNGQQFDLPLWITPKMKFITTSNLPGSVPIAKYVNDMTYCSYAIQPDIYSGSDVMISLMDNEQNVILLSVSCTVSSSPIKSSKVKEQLIKSCMRFQYMECLRKRKNDVEFSYKKPKHFQIGLNSNSILLNNVTANEEDNLEREEKKEYDQDLNYDDLNYDLNYAENIKNYQISKVSERIKLHKQIKTSTDN
ncbi:3640_t:CDS:2 [Funneliformis caledonium]|uniref:3640_t:CDS:1 n=1 Tax=Funneliformis caledonium TaxID=1117310 RepID=A0A9N9GBA9_9GLOM|nr:3640_t:CDS:2 [Funneliformis caledonium]